MSEYGRCVTHHACDCLRDQLAEMQAERDRLREALEWYADLANWTAPIDPANIRGSILQAEIATEIDIGQRARAALVASEQGGKERAGGKE